MPERIAAADAPLLAAVAEVAEHVESKGWDQPVGLFALVRAARFAVDEPAAAARLGIDGRDVDALTPVEQGELPDRPLDELLGGISWPAAVAGCALSQEIVVLPPGVDAALLDAQAAARHPARREARLVVGVLRDGASAAVLRLRGPADGADGGASEDGVLTGPDLAPNLVAALLATFD